MKLCICCLLALLWSLPLSAEIYKIKDAQGNIIYTDTPPAEGQQHEVVELGPINTQPAVEPLPTFRPAPESEEEAVNYTISLAAPAEGTHVPPGQRDLRVAAQVEPALLPAHRIRFMMDGKPLGDPSQNTRVLIEEIYRGTHTLSAQLLDAQGNLLASTPTVTVYVHRPTILNPP